MWFDFRVKDSLGLLPKRLKGMELEPGDGICIMEKESFVRAKAA